MAKRRRYTPEQIITKLREAEVYLSQGKTVGQACKALEISEQTYYRWRREYGKDQKYDLQCLRYCN
jgi:transposase-like protein